MEDVKVEAWGNYQVELYTGDYILEECGNKAIIVFALYEGTTRSEIALALNDDELINKDLGFWLDKAPEFFNTGKISLE